MFSRDKRTPYEKTRDEANILSRQIRHEKRQLDREINKFDREIQRITMDLRKKATNNNATASKILARQIIKLRKSRSQFYMAKSNLDTIESEIKSQLSYVKLSGVMQKSSSIASSMAELMKFEQFQSIAQEFSKELIKMGVIGDMINDSTSFITDNDETEQETDEEIQKVLDEIIANQIPRMPSVAHGHIVDNESDEEMEQRLQAIKS